MGFPRFPLNSSVSRQPLETPILSRYTILDILQQQQQRKFFLRQRHIFTQRAELRADVERLFALEDVHFVFFMFEDFSNNVFSSTLIYSEEQLCCDQPKSSECMLNCKKNIPDTTIILIWCEITAHKLSKRAFSSSPRNHTKRFVRRHQQAHQYNK